MGVLTQAMYHARELAMTRMEEEADQLGADGIVGVRLDVGRYEWGAELAEFIAIGTAVRHAGESSIGRPTAARSPRTSPARTSATLLRSGYRPVGLVMGNCVYHVAHRDFGPSWKQIGQQPGDAQLHPGAVRRARAGHGADAGGGRALRLAVSSARGSTRPATAGART